MSTPPKMRQKKTPEDFSRAAKKSYSIAEMCRQLGLRPSGGNYRIIHSAIDKYKIDTKHFRGKGWNVGLKFKPTPPRPIHELLVKGSRYQSYKLKNRLLKEGIKKQMCECCNLTQWQEHDIPLELHHINGDNTDNRLDNLALLCPNCHALTDCYRGKNITIRH